MSRPDKIHEIYTTGLRNQHAVEQLAIELLERQIGRQEKYPEMVQQMQRHLAESKAQAERIEELRSNLATSHLTMKDTAMSLVCTLMAIGHVPAGDEVIKSKFAIYAFERYETASYKALLTVADEAGHSAANSALGQSLREEQAMAQWIEDHIKPTTLRFLERSSAGEKAGH